MKMATILINAFSAKLGGGKTYIENILPYIPSACVVYICCHDDVVLPQKANLHRLPVSFPTYHPIPRLIWERYMLPAILKRLKIDVLFCPGGVVNTPRVKGCQVVTMFRNMLPFDVYVLQGLEFSVFKLKNFILRRSMSRSMSKADNVIFISEYARSFIQDKISFKSGETIYHGLSEGFRVHGDKADKPDLPFDDDYILYVSRFEFYKRHMELVEAYSMLPKCLQDRYKMLIVGGNSTPSGEVVKKSIKEKGLCDRVILIGEFPYLKLPAIYSNASLFVFASACENCPNILLEALGAGVPIICSNKHPMPEFGADAVVYFNPDDPREIADAMQGVLGNEKWRDELRMKSKARAEDFCWETTGRRTWDLLLKQARVGTA